MRTLRDARGFVSLEVLAAATIVATVLLAVATMFLTAYHNVERSARTTTAVALARHLIEDLRSVPFDEIEAFDGLDTTDPASSPAAEPGRGIARRWRYAVAGDSPAWSFTSSETAVWNDFGDRGAPLAGAVEVTAPTPSMRLVTVTLSVAGRAKPFRIATLISRT